MLLCFMFWLCFSLCCISTRLSASTDVDLWCKNLEATIVQEIEDFHTTSTQQTRDCAFLVKITQFNIPLTITQPGIYCVGENLTVNAQSLVAISIQSDNVILDLNDNQIVGITTAGTSGVLFNGRNNIIIRNGSIRNMANRGIGINIQGSLSSQNVLIEQMEFINDNNGLTLVNTRNWVLRDSVAFQNQANGFLLTSNTSGIVSVCLSNNNNNGFSGNLNNGIIFSNCIANFNATNGFNAAGLRNSQFENCTVHNNQNIGFFFTNSGAQMCNSCSLKECHMLQNGSIGLQLTGNNHDVQTCIAKNNTNGFEIHGNNHIFLNNIAQFNSNIGFLFAGASSGFPSSTNCQVRSNTATANTTGFSDLGVNNRIYSNFANNNTTNYNNIVNVSISPTSLEPINFITNIAE